MREMHSTPEVKEKLSRHLNGPGNPFRDPEVRKRAVRRNRELGYPGLRRRGGNGTGLTEPQRLLSQRLGWPTEVVVVTDSQARSEGSPNSYSVDVAEPERLIAVEVDGESHKSLSRQESDSRKDEFLRRAGWTVYRFTNRQVMTDLDSVVSSILRPSTVSTSPTES